MSKNSRNRKPQPKRFWTPMRIGLIGSALVLVAAIASVFFRSRTEEINPAVSAPGKNLVDASGTPFNPTTTTALATWLGGATATNMAYMLSAQLAATTLSLRHGFVNGNAFVYVLRGRSISWSMTRMVLLALMGIRPQATRTGRLRRH